MRPNNAFPSNTPLLISTKVCQTSELLTWLTNFSFSCMQSQYLSMLFVVYPSGVSRATLSCLHRLSARSSSSLTSSPSPPILMSFMRMPKNSLEDRCVHCDPLIFLFSFRRVHHTYNLLHTDSVWSDSAMRFLSLYQQTILCILKEKCPKCIRLWGLQQEKPSFCFNTFTQSILSCL